VGAVAGYSYGDAVDRQLAAVGEQVDRAPSPASNLAKLVAGRFDFALINSEELDHLIAQSPDLAGSIVRLELPDVPPGKARHLMCSRNVDAGLIERMDQAITRLRFDRGR
jgi:polar amino acid transport system substrate-binding protein